MIGDRCLRHGCDGVVDADADFCSIECVPTEASRAALADCVCSGLVDTMPGLTWVERDSSFGPTYNASGGAGEAWTARASDVDPQRITLTVSLGEVEADGAGASVRDALGRLAAGLYAAAEAVCTARAGADGGLRLTARVERRGGHDHVAVWADGQAIGRLCIGAGGGPALAALLRRPGPPAQLEQNPHRCPDGNCVLLVPGAPVGMHTNGGCRCLRDPRGHEGVRVRAGIAWLAAQAGQQQQKEGESC